MPLRLSHSGGTARLCGKEGDSPTPEKEEKQKEEHFSGCLFGFCGGGCKSLRHHPNIQGQRELRERTTTTNV